MKKEGREQKQFVVNIITLVIVAFLASMLNEHSNSVDISGQATNDWEASTKAFNNRGFTPKHSEAWSLRAETISERWNQDSNRGGSSAIKTENGVIIFIGNNDVFIKTNNGMIFSVPAAQPFSKGEKVTVTYQYDPTQKEEKVISILKK